MTARSAEARNADECRQERLAQDPDGDRPAVPNDSIIPAHPGKVSAYLVLGLAAWGGLLWAGQTSLTKGLGLDPIVSFESGRLVSYFSTVSLIIAAELSFVILWARSRARKEALGWPWIWGCAGVFWGLISFFQATGLHHPLSRMALEHWPLETYRPETLCWLVPLAAGFFVLHRVLASEMRQTVPSEMLWNVMLLPAAATAALELGLEDSIPEEYRAAGIAGTRTLWHFSIVAALLVHARYVAHVTNEAGPRKSNLVVRFLRGVRQRAGGSTTSSHGKNSASGSPSKSTSKPATDSKPASKSAIIPAVTASASRVPASEAAAKAKPTPVRQAVAPEEVAAEEAARQAKKRVLGQTIRIDAAESDAAPPHTGSSSNRKPQSHGQSGRNARFADEDDEEFDEYDDFARMSRKERKRLRKLQRSQDGDY